MKPAGIAYYIGLTILGTIPVGAALVLGYTLGQTFRATVRHRSFHVFRRHCYTILLSFAYLMYFSRWLPEIKFWSYPLLGMFLCSAVVVFLSLWYPKEQPKQTNGELYNLAYYDSVYSDWDSYFTEPRQGTPDDGNDRD